MPRHLQRLQTTTILLFLLAAFIMPFIQIPEASATTFDFYGGYLETGGEITTAFATINFDHNSGNFDSFICYIYDGATEVASFSSGSYYVPGGVTVECTASGILEAGHTYTFSITIFPASIGVIWITNPYVVIGPSYTVNFRVAGLDSTATGTVATVDGVPLTYTQLQTYSTTIAEGDTVTFSYEATVVSTNASKTFSLVSANATSPKTVTADGTVTGTYTTDTVPTETSLTIKGPYFEDGTVATGYTVTYTLMYVNSTVYKHSITSTGTAGTNYIYSENSTLTQLSWNASSTSGTLNSTRIYSFANGQHGIDDSTVYLYILDPAKPAYQYTFTITDFFGMEDPYLQTSVAPDGTTSYVVERSNLKDSDGYVTFVMQQYQMYTLTFICSQGTYSQNFTPAIIGMPGQNAVSLPVSAGSFPSADTTSTSVVTATKASNVITITYYDVNETTTWVQAAITHTNGDTTVTDYTSPNATGSSHTFLWTQADAQTNYKVNVTALVNGETKTWNIPISSAVGTNPWESIDWSNIGAYIPTLPTTYTGWGGIDPNQAIATFIILAALGIGSYFSTGISCLVCWVIAGVLYALGWWQTSIPTFVFAAVITAWILIDEYKKGALNI